MLYLPRSQACVVLLSNDGGFTLGAASAPFLGAVDSGCKAGPAHGLDRTVVGVS